MSKPISSNKIKSNNQLFENDFAAFNTIKKYPNMKQYVWVLRGKNDNGLSPTIIKLHLSKCFINAWGVGPNSLVKPFFTMSDLLAKIVRTDENNIPKNTKNPEKSFPKNEDITKYETIINGSILYIINANSDKSILLYFLFTFYLVFVPF